MERRRVTLGRGEVNWSGTPALLLDAGFRRGAGSRGEVPLDYPTTSTAGYWMPVSSPVGAESLFAGKSCCGGAGTDLISTSGFPGAGKGAFATAAPSGAGPSLPESTALASSCRAAANRDAGCFLVCSSGSSYDRGPRGELAALGDTGGRILLIPDEPSSSSVTMASLPGRAFGIATPVFVASAFCGDSPIARLRFSVIRRLDLRPGFARSGLPGDMFPMPPNSLGCASGIGGSYAASTSGTDASIAPARVALGLERP